MTETEWMTTGDIVRLLKFLGQRRLGRKRRLFAVACVRRMCEVLGIDPSGQRAIDVAELHSDGMANDSELGVFYPTMMARRSATFAFQNIIEAESSEGFDDAAAGNSAWATVVEGTLIPDDGGISTTKVAAEEALQADFLRDIFGNPFRPVAFDPDWRTSTAVAIAQLAYDSREFGNLPVLADALQDAGCENADILDHLRGPGPHVRGCWVVDLVLGKS